MNYDESIDLLLAEAEGRLPAERKAELEELLRRSPERRSELEDLRAAFAELRRQETPPVPEGYFNGLLSAVRSGIRRRPFRIAFAVPSWFQPLAAPAAALLIIAVMAGLYPALHDEPAPASVLAAAAEEDGWFDAGAELLDGGVSGEQRLLALADGAVVRSVLLNGESVSAVPSDGTVLTDTQLLSHLNEQEIEAIVAGLSQRSAP